MRKNLSYGNGYINPRLQKQQSPSLQDIAWATGLYEGEGSAYSKSQQVGLVQKDPWILYRLQKLFGGSIGIRQSHGSRLTIWLLSGARARGFLMTIYYQLSPRRQKQALKVIRHEKI